MICEQLIVATMYDLCSDKLCRAFQDGWGFSFIVIFLVVGSAYAGIDEMCQI
jgi:hypothetical protein